MSFNLNLSRKSEVTLNGNLVHEMINMYGIPVKWLFSERVNEDFVFQDFSHMKVGQEYQDVTLKPEESENFIGDSVYNGFGIFNQQTTSLFISAIDIKRLYPNWMTDKGMRSKVVNSLIITPSTTILEITHLESFVEGVSNLWLFGDNPDSYKLTCKVYSNNLSDEGTTEIQTQITLDEDEIFNHSEEIDTHELDAFFDNLELTKEEQDTIGDQKSNTDSVFGNLG